MQSSILSMASNPLTLNMLCHLSGRVDPTRLLTRTALYRELLQQLAGLEVDGHFDASRSAAILPLVGDVFLRWFELNAGKRPLEPEQVLESIRIDERRPIPLGLQIEKIGNFSSEEKAEYLLSELQRKGLIFALRHDREVWGYPHRSIAEYLASTALAEKLSVYKLQIDWLAEKADDPGWTELIVFAVGNLLLRHRHGNGVSLVLSLISSLTDRSQDDELRHRLGLAIRCLSEFRNSTFAEQVQNSVVNAMFTTYNEHIECGTFECLSHLFEVWHVLLEIEGSCRNHCNALAATAEIFVKSQDPTVRAHAISAISTAAAEQPFRLDLVQLLIKAAEDPDERIAIPALGGLSASARNPAQTDSLIRILWRKASRASTIGAAMAAAEAITRLGLPFLRNSLTFQEFANIEEENTDQGACRAAAWVAGYFGPRLIESPELRSTLARCMRSADSQVRRAAAWAIGRMGARVLSCPDLAQHFVRLAACDPDKLVRSQALSSAAAFGVSAVISLDLPPILLKSLLDPEQTDNSSAMALRSLGMAGIGSSSVSEVIVRGLQDTDLAIESRALSALAILAGFITPSVSMLKAVEKLIWSHSFEVRNKAVSTLLRLERKGAVDAILRRCLCHWDMVVREIAGRALGPELRTDTAPTLVKSRAAIRSSIRREICLIRLGCCGAWTKLAEELSDCHPVLLTSLLGQKMQSINEDVALQICERAAILAGLKYVPREAAKNVTIMFTLRDFINDTDPTVRITSFETLRELTWVALQNERAQAQLGLQRLQDAIPVLRRNIPESGPLFVGLTSLFLALRHGDRSIRTAAAESIRSFTHLGFRFLERNGVVSVRCRSEFPC